MKSMFEQIAESYCRTKSVKDTAEELCVSRNTVQRVLITEGLWESKRSKEIVKLFHEGFSAQEIADRLFLSLKCVQNYMPYTKGMNNERITEDSIKSREKRERMKRALEGQKAKTILCSQNERGDADVVMIDGSLLDTKGAYERMEHIEWGEPVRKEDRPNVSAKTYIPSALRLHLELVDYNGKPFEFSGDETDILKKHAKYQNAFSRDILVPGEMSLNSLSYAIQKLFGWQNSHLHSFVLEDEMFDRLTARGNLEQWESLCGVLFRYPDEDYLDKYCNDDYDGTMSFKSWLKSKYCGMHMSFSVGDTYIENRRLVAELEEKIYTIRASKKINSVKEIQRFGAISGEYDALLERLLLNSIFLPTGVSIDLNRWIDDTRGEIIQKEKRIAEKKANQEQYILLLNSLTELRRRRMTQSDLEKVIRRGPDFSKAAPTSAERAYHDNRKIIDYYQYVCNKLLSALEPRISPFTHSILYRYDLGDDWCVKVTCEEGYYINDGWDFPNEQGWVTVAVSEDAQVNDWDFYSSKSNQKITGELAEMLRGVVKRNTPLCLSSDGIYLLDDVGGIYGFIKMLKTIHGENTEEATQMREWAKMRGWTGRATKPSNML